MEGIIKKVIRDRGFGFLTAADGSEVFFHRSALEGIELDALAEGDGVVFNVESGPKGPRAATLRKIPT